MKSWSCLCRFELDTDWGALWATLTTTLTARCLLYHMITLQWRHKERDGIWNHRRLYCLHRSRSKKTSKLCVPGFCEGNLPVTGEFLAQRTSNAENVSIWWHFDEIPFVSSWHKVQGATIILKPSIKEGTGFGKPSVYFSPWVFSSR